MLTLWTEISTIVQEMAAAPGFLQSFGAACAIFILLGAFLSNSGTTITHVVVTIIAFIVAEEWLRYTYLLALDQHVTLRPSALAFFTLGGLIISFAAGTILDNYMAKRNQERIRELKNAEAKLHLARTSEEMASAIENAQEKLATTVEEE